MRRVGSWELVELLQRGGMGEVWRARQLATGRAAAVKLLPAPLADAVARQRFSREARVLDGCREPGLVRYLEGEPHGPAPWFAMELLEGESLAAALRRGPLPVERALRLVSLLARTVGALHARGIVHRDLKPENVFLTRAGQPVLLDLGLAQLPDARLTATGEVLGSPGFLAPEQAAGTPGEPDPRTDVYGLGAVLHAALTGRPPFEGTGVAVLAAVMSQAPRPPSAWLPGLDPRVDALVLACLAKLPAERPWDGAAVESALRELLAGRARRARPRGPLVAAACLLAAAVVVAGLALRSAGPDDDPLALGQRAMKRHEQGDLRGALADYDRSLALLPGQPRLLASRAQARRLTGDLDGAAADLERALALDPDDVSALVNRSALRRASGELEPALADLDRAIRLAPGLVPAWVARASIRSRLRDPRAALADAERALELAPAHGPAHLLRVRILIALEAFEAAREALDRGIELAPGEPWLWLDRAGLRLRLGDERGAEEDLARLTRDHPGFAASAHLLLAGFHQARDVPRALSELDQALASDPDCALALARRGALRCKSGREAEGLADFERAVELDAGADQPEVLRLSIAAFQRAGRSEAAAASLARLARFDPNAPDLPQLRRSLGR